MAKHTPFILCDVLVYHRPYNTYCCINNWYQVLRCGHRLLQQQQYEQGCEPRTESHFFRSVFLGFSRQKTDFLKSDFLKSVFRLPKKNATEKPTRFFSVGFLIPVPYANNAYIPILKPRHIWTVLQPPQTAARRRATRHRCNVLLYTCTRYWYYDLVPPTWFIQDLGWTSYIQELVQPRTVQGFLYRNEHGLVPPTWFIQD